jgi:hypothetical protein
MHASKRTQALAAIVLLLALLASAPPARAQAPARQNGVSYAAWYHGLYSTPDSDLSLAHLAETGADWLALIVTQYQDNYLSTTIGPTDGTVTDDDLRHAIGRAHALGLKVMLKPHLDLAADWGHWRGQIGEGFTTEAQWRAWFSSYRAFILHYAGLAQANGVEQFCIGTELAGVSPRATEWRALIAAVRAQYSGPLTYAAGFGGEEVAIAWWDAVDYIGVDAYYTLTNKDDPTLTELKAGWAGPIATLSALAQRTGKTILFTELGYRSVQGTNRAPWDYQSNGPVDLQEQADCYRAYFEMVYDQPWSAGVYWWSWSVDPQEGGECDKGYTPHEKPAEDILRARFDGQPRPRAGGPQPDERAPLVIYGDALAAGWSNWSWSAMLNLAATNPVYLGTRSVSATLGGWGAIRFAHSNLDISPYYFVEFAVRAANGNYPQLAVAFWDADGQLLPLRMVSNCRYVAGGSVEPGQWKIVRIPLSDLGAAGATISSIAILERSGATASFWVDELRLLRAAWRVRLPVLRREPM